MTRTKLASKATFSHPPAWTSVVSWSRMQAESGEHLTEIVGRKEIERRANDGIFLWGVGNAPNRSTSALAEARADVDALFSIMKSRPKLVDVSPASTLIWRRYIDAQGVVRSMPAGSLVTSRGTVSTGVKRNHFALICQSNLPLELSDYGPFDPTVFRNMGDVGGPIGSSQVTALLRRVSDDVHVSYRVNLKAKLAGSFWVKLVDPIVADSSLQADLDNFRPTKGKHSILEWKSLLKKLRRDEGSEFKGQDDQLRLL